MRVFTPFWKRVLSLGDLRKPLPAPQAIAAACRYCLRQAGRLAARTDKARLGGRIARQLGRPAKPRPANGWPIFSTAFAAIPTSATGRTSPRRHGSRPHLRFGEISAARNFPCRAIRRRQKGVGHTSRDIEKFLSELGWREFSYHLLHHFPDLATQNLQSRFDAFPWRSDDAELASLAARPDRLSDRRCRHARALAHRLDAQPRAHDRRVVPDQASADRLAARRGMVLGHAGRCRPRQQRRELAMGRGLGRRCRALFPHLQSDAAGREIRSGRRSMCGTGCRRSRPCPTASSTSHGWHRRSILAEAKVAFGKTYPAPIVDHDMARKRALAAFEIKG